MYSYFQFKKNGILSLPLILRGHVRLWKKNKGSFKTALEHRNKAPRWAQMDRKNFVQYRECFLLFLLLKKCVSD